MPQRSRTGRPSHGPLKPAHYFILLAIADGDQHGYAIRKSVDELSGGQVKLWPTTLYGSIHQLVDDGLIAELEAFGRSQDEAEPAAMWRVIHLSAGMRNGLGPRHDRREARRLGLEPLMSQAREAIVAATRIVVGR